MDSILKDVAKSEDKFVSDLQLWREYEAKEKAIRDERSYLIGAMMDGIEEGEKKGIAKGRAQGRAEEKRATACNLLKLGIDFQTIVAATGLSLEEVKALSKGRI